MTISIPILVLAAVAMPAEAPRQARIGNRFLERTFEVRNGVLESTGLLNKLDQRYYAMDSEEFELHIVWERLQYEHGTENPVRLTAADFEVQDIEHRTPSGGDQRLTFLLENRRYGVEVRVVFELAAGVPFLRKHLEIRSPGNSRVFLDKVAVESFRLQGAAPRLGGFGQPVYAGNLFFGVEYPASQNLAEGGGVRCDYYSGETTGKDWLASEPAVTGVSPDGAVSRTFLDYVSRIRSGKVRPVTVFNTWYDMQGDSLTAENSMERMKTLKARLLDPFDIRLDSFVLDDGWDEIESVWGIHPRRFQGGFSGFRRFLESHGTRLGLWFGPVGGYGSTRTARLAAAARRGYEISANGQYFCLAGTKYRERFKQVVLEMISKYGVNHLKFDGVPYGCNAAGHGHLPGIYSREAHLRAFLDILKSAREANPDVFLNITTGNWLSPWWLKYADVVFMGGHDYGFLNEVPAAGGREKAITYRDKVLYDDFRRHEYQFPQSSIMTIGIIKGTLGAEGALKEDLESWTRNAIMNYSRGSMFTELYVSPAILTDEEWRSLGLIAAWAKANQDVLLADTRFIGGDPARGEVYGYAHFSRDRGIVTLRNPTIEPRSHGLVLNPEAGLDPTGQRFRARVVYPYVEWLPGSFGYGDSVRLDVQGQQVLVVELLPESPHLQEMPAGVRLGSDRAVYDAASARSGQVRVESLEFAGAHGSFQLRAPANARNLRLVMRWRPEESGEKAAVRLRVDGSEAGLTLVSPASTEQGLGYGEGRWTVAIAPVPSAQSRIEFEVAPADSGEIGFWLFADFLLDRKPLEVPAAALPVHALPAASGKDYRTSPLFTRRVE
jgi:hypothetical protein